jgi:hypothetical protein
MMDDITFADNEDDMSLLDDPTVATMPTVATVDSDVDGQSLRTSDMMMAQEDPEDEDATVVSAELIDPNASPRNRGSRFLITTNNYTDDDILAHQALVDSGKVFYMVYGKEIAPTTGTPHLQGFIVCKDRMRISALKKFLPRTRIDVVKHYSKNRDLDKYCRKTRKKDPVPNAEVFSYGDLPPDPVSTAGKRSDWEDLRDDIKKEVSLPRLADKYPHLYATCLQGILNLRDAYYEEKNLRLVDVKNIVPRPWYQTVTDIIASPDDRLIHFFVDFNGGTGKSTLCKLYARDPTVQLLRPGKDNDMALLLDPSASTFILDVPRSRGHSDLPLPYNLLEQIKDGTVQCGKYSSKIKRMRPLNSVIVLMNEVPDGKALSGDRYKVYKVKPDYTAVSMMFDFTNGSFDGHINPLLKKSEDKKLLHELNLDRAKSDDVKRNGNRD